MDFTFGAMFIGVLFATFFQGLLSSQAFIYYESFPDDLRRMKLLVAVVWCGHSILAMFSYRLCHRILDAAHLVLICQSCYHYLVTSWGNDAALLLSTKSLDLHLTFVGLATLLCQGFFLHRIWMFSKQNWILTGILTVACIVVFALDVLLSVQLLQVPIVSYFSVHTAETVTLFSLGGAVDVAIALVLVMYLQQGRTSFDQTNFILTRVIHYTVATGLATSILAVGCLAAYLASPHTFVFIAMHFSLGRLYTNALLATLNSRRNLRQANTHFQPSFSVMTTRVVTSVVDEEFPMTPRSAKEFPILPPPPRAA
ncbi:ANK-REP-region domain-containing protein [Favolaschia claudopus]|uniref:ANK-REP-region domain-containing protein n=1 Tax=Favolaschia claudopus TaxID=2862362 RepID=A0AAW0D2G0_9AGAR